MEFHQNTLERQRTKLVIVKAKALPHGQFEAVLSTEDLDRHGERVSLNGMNIPKDQTIKMYYNHETGGDNLPIGKWLKVWKKDGKLMGQGEVDLEDDFAVKVYKKVLKGIIDSISIGFMPEEYDGSTATWTKATLVEASVVAEPANVNAVITQKDLGFTNDDFEKSFQERKEKLVSVKRIVKGAVMDVLTEQDKWEMMEDFYEVIEAFCEAYYSPDAKVTDFPTLLTETIQILQTVADGTYQDPDDSMDSGPMNLSAELKTAIDDLNSRQGALEAAVKAASENPAKKNIEKIRVALKQVDQSAESANRIVKVTLMEKTNG